MPCLAPVVKVTPSGARSVSKVVVPVLILVEPLAVCVVFLFASRRPRERALAWRLSTAPHGAPHSHGHDEVFPPDHARFPLAMTSRRVRHAPSSDSSAPTCTGPRQVHHCEVILLRRVSRAKPPPRSDPLIRYRAGPRRRTIQFLDFMSELGIPIHPPPLGLRRSSWVGRTSETWNRSCTGCGHPPGTLTSGKASLIFVLEGLGERVQIRLASGPRARHRRDGRHIPAVKVERRTFSTDELGWRERPSDQVPRLLFRARDRLVTRSLSAASRAVLMHLA